MDLVRLAFRSLPLWAGLGCATQAERAPDETAKVEAADVAAPAANMRAGEPATLAHAMAALNAKGSECAEATEEPGVVICDRGRVGHVTVVMAWQDPRLLVISHILKADGVDCKQAAPKINEVNRSFDHLALLCADNLTFRTTVTMSDAGMRDDELFRYVDDFRKEIQTLIRAGMLKEIAKE